MSASFSIQYIYKMVDQFSPGANKLAGAAKRLAQSVKQAGIAANATVGGLTRVGAAARTAGSSWKYYADMALLAAKRVNQIAKTRVDHLLNGPGRRGRGLDATSALGALGIGWWGKGVLEQAKQASIAENRFRSLVDSVDTSQMQALTRAFYGQMSLTGETYAELLNAAADAAQIVGNADYAREITIAASKLAKIDTDGKDTKFFAESLAAILGPNGTMADLASWADKLAAQQKLGAATAGGTLEAYKNVVAMQEFSGADPNALLSMIGLIKNMAPALQDSEIGNWSKYGLRMMTMGKPADWKALANVGIDRNAVRDKFGNVDLAKIQEQLFRIDQAGGREMIEKAFGGKNVLAGQFWLSALGMSPEKFRAYYDSLLNSQGSLDKAFGERTVGLEGAMNRLLGTMNMLKIELGKFVTPAVEKFAEAAAGAMVGLTDWLMEANEAPSFWTKLAGGVLAGFAAFTAITVPLAAVLWSLGTIARMTGVSAILRGVFGGLTAIGTGVVGGVAGAAAHLGAMIGSTYRLSGALAAAGMAARMLGRAFVLGLAIEGVVAIINNLDRLKQYASEPIKFEVLFPDAPQWLRWFMERVEGPKRDNEGRSVLDYSQPLLDPNGFLGKSWASFENLWEGAKSYSPTAPGGMLDISSIPVAVSTSIDPIQINGGTLNFQFSGAPVNGPTSFPLTAAPSRGTSTVEGGATAPVGGR